VHFSLTSRKPGWQRRPDGSKMKIKVGNTPMILRQTDTLDL
jgi:hypothetical protein